MSARTKLCWCSNICLLAGGILLAGFAIVQVQVHAFQSRERRAFAAQLLAVLRARARAARAKQASALLRAATPGSVIGELEIPRLRVNALILEGDNSTELRRGAGHIPGTALPGFPSGNMAIAGHRDTIFRPLRNIRTGDLILVRTVAGTYSYSVQYARVVTPNDVPVLGGTRERELTLVTCYPFYYVGSAPNRFIVRARAVE